jgi:hypothetical protein
LILIGWIQIRIQEGKNVPQNSKSSVVDPDRVVSASFCRIGIGIQGMLIPDTADPDGYGIS